MKGSKEFFAINIYMEHETNHESSLGKPIKLGFVGYGNIAKVHRRAIQGLGSEYFVVEAIADTRSVDTDDEEVKVYRDLEIMLSDPRIQAVSINTPPNTHRELVERALNAGKHVLVEKPPALTVEDAQSMIRLAEEKSGVLYFAWHAAQHLPIKSAKKELANKKVTSIDIEYKEDVSRYHDKHSWVMSKEIAGGGVLMDSGINAISAVTHILPDINFNVEDAGFTYPEGLGVETAADVRFTFGNNTSGRLNMDWQYKKPESSDGPDEIRRTTIVTEEHDIYVFDAVSDQLIKNGVVIAGNPDDTTVKLRLDAEYEGIYADFANCIANGTSSVSTKELRFVQDAYAAR